MSAPADARGNFQQRIPRFAMKSILVTNGTRPPGRARKPIDDFILESLYRDP